MDLVEENLAGSTRWWGGSVARFGTGWVSVVLRCLHFSQLS